jgi:putative transposase
VVRPSQKFVARWASQHNLLQVEAAGSGYGDRGVDPVATVGRREQEVEIAGGGPDARQAHVARGAQKKVLKPVRKRALAEFLRGGFQISERRACQVLNLQRSVYYYRSRADPQTELRLRLKDLAVARVRYGYERLHTLLRREGWQINHNGCIAFITRKA